MSKNRLLPLLFCSMSAIGGQALLDGVMLRNGRVYSLAVRHVNGEIRARRYLWHALPGSFWHDIPFVRGFPILLETVINGVQAVSRAAALSGREGAISPLRFLATVLLAILLASVLFIVAPHLLSAAMQAIQLGGDVQEASFHIWDGIFKVLIFMGYVGMISLIPDIRRVFEYHGAEHKTVHAWESCIFVDSLEAAGMNRLHPRCGTTFVLFVVAISIFLQTLLVPHFVVLLPAHNPILRHAASILFKIALIIPVSGAAYEIICLAAGLSGSLLGSILQSPGMILQRFTTREPASAELEVAIVALKEAVASDESASVLAVPYQRIQSQSPVS